MLVDKQTGVALRLAYYADGKGVGFAGLRDLAIDGVGGQSSAAAAVRSLVVPKTARRVDFGLYRATGE